MWKVWVFIGEKSKKTQNSIQCSIVFSNLKSVLYHKVIPISGGDDRKLLRTMECSTDMLS